MSFSEELGRIIGGIWGPAVRVGATLRHARLLHPEGITYRAEVKIITPRESLQPVASRLAGPALVRLSTALWRGQREWPDVLGLAVRLRSEEAVTEEPSPGDQDLLFATVRSPWTLGLAPFSTDTHDFLENDYYAVSPFLVNGLGRAKLRAVASHVDAPGHSRVERLEAARRSGQARFTFEVRPLRGEAAGRWYPLVELRLLEQVELPPATLRFWPYRNGRGITPVGFVHSLRLSPYRQSQEARSLH
ncbi:hypothetical protein [Hyalangium minutum]|uniref:Uncharacterized protein n=1 Tax=Hyalangium minutum TaxID=394096 RepID=A0A085WV42_9BACT|nr:hypothetical protein [Hyalangium minutum]KFE71555.1 hypothetical protein DB31_3685 [Hyalangium minutum]